MACRESERLDWSEIGMICAQEDVDVLGIGCSKTGV